MGPKQSLQEVSTSLRTCRTPRGLELRPYAFPMPCETKTCIDVQDLVFITGHANYRPFTVDHSKLHHRTFLQNRYTMMTLNIRVDPLRALSYRYLTRYPTAGYHGISGSIKSHDAHSGLELPNDSSSATSFLGTVERTGSHAKTSAPCR